MADRVGPFVKACLNGARLPGSHPALPLTARELAADAAECARAGAGAIHLHPRGPDGLESFHAEIVDAVLRTVRADCELPIGVSTGAWAERDPKRRAALVRAWSEPDFASVNLSEPGADHVIEALLGAGIGVEAGVWSAADAEHLAELAIDTRLTRILVEVVSAPSGEAVQVARTIESRLDRLGLTAPRVVHGVGPATWPVLRYAIAAGNGTRIGLEDTFELPNGEPAGGNAQLVARAIDAAA
jgi:uncharacterized protein (DUF849 family)